MKKIKDPWKSRTYRREALELLVERGPQIAPCQHCGHPVIDGYCCTFCGSADPGDVEDPPSLLD